MNVINHIEKVVQANPAIMDEMVKQTGKTKEELTGWLKPNAGEIITICDGCTSELGGGAQGNQTGIFFEASLVNDYGTYKEDDALYEANQIGIAMTILHEATHRGDALTNGHTTRGTSDDLGLQKTKSAHGHRGTDVEMKVLGNGVEMTGQEVSKGKYVTPQGDLKTVKGRLTQARGLYNSFFKGMKADNDKSKKESNSPAVQQSSDDDRGAPGIKIH